MPSACFRACCVTIATASLLLVVAGSPATAKIRCNNGYQLVGSDEISTPYCQDEYVAVVARDYGIKTTGARIRNDWGHKRDVCSLIGQDIRIRNACISEDDRGDAGSPYN